MANINTLAGPISADGAKVFGQDKNGTVGWMPATDPDIYSNGPMGGPGAGVCCCPPTYLPLLMIPKPGCTTIGHANYGNYTAEDGSDMVCVGKSFYRINDPRNPSYSAHTSNDIMVVGSETYANRDAAAVDGFVLERAFIDGGVEKPCFFIDKWQVSKNAKGTGYVGSSIRNGLPLSSSSAHNPVGGLTACAGTNKNSMFLLAAKARDGIDGAINPLSRYFSASAFMFTCLARIAMAHGQAATGETYCAWYDPTMVKNFPKGCNNNALRDYSDTTVVYQSDGYPNCGKTGSGYLLAKTTHNGQECGVADINGLMWEVLTGMTCIGTTKAITGVTLASPCVLTVVGHGLTTGDVSEVGGIVGTTQLNSKIYTITVIDPDTISLDGVDATGYTAYTSGGTLYTGKFYVAKESVRMRDFTAGGTLATDHWGAVGVAAMMEEVTGVLVALPGGSSVNQYFGNGTNQVLSGDASGNGYKLASLGFAKDTNGYSASGTDLFGKDLLEQYIRNELCLLGCGYWYIGASTGPWSRHLYYTSGGAYYNIGARFACYPD